MASKNEIFEIHLQRDGRWQIDSTAYNQADGEAAARKALSRAGVSAAKVVKETTRGSTAREQVVFEQSRSTGASDKVFVGEIDTAPVCEEADDLYGIDGRQTINRLFRAYLDKNGVTASEVMHEFRELRRLLDADNLVMSGIGKVSALQAKSDPDATANVRRDALFGFLDEVTARARAAADKKLPTIRAEGFDAVIDKITATAGEDDCGFLLRVVVARELVQQRSYFGKLTQAIDWAEPCESEQGRKLADTYVSDILSNAETLQDLLGLQDSLGAALGSLIDLAQGAFEVDVDGKAPDTPEAVAGRLTGLFAANSLPDSQVVLVDRVRRQIEGKGQLSRGGGEEDGDVFRSLIDKLMPVDDLLGGGAMAEALTQRQSRIINRGGVNGLKEAANRLLPAFGDPVRKVGYLLSLSESGLAGTIGDEIDMQLEGLFVRPESVKHIVRDDRPPNKKMQTVTAVYRKIHGSSIDAVLKNRIVTRLDELLARYITEDRILEKIDDPSRPLHVRAFMLLAMCSPDMLPEGQASKLARQIVVKHLKRKNFEDELVAQVPAAEKERVLRDFHVQLYRCGFMQ